MASVQDIVASLIQLQEAPQTPAMGALMAAREQLATQPQRMPTSYGTPDADAAAMSPETFANPAVRNVLGSLAAIPERAIRGSMADLATLGTGEPKQSIAPATDAALWMMGGAGAVPAEANALRSGLTAARIPIRDVGAEIGHEGLSGLTKPGHFYRGMSEAEYNNTIGAGKDIRSNESASVPGEGTNFAEDAPTAESYANFGRSDPRKTGSPNYLVEVAGPDGLKMWRDGYFKAESIPRDRITSVIRMAPENGAIVGTPIPLGP